MSWVTSPTVAAISPTRASARAASMMPLCLGRAAFRRPGGCSGAVAGGYCRAVGGGYSRSVAGGVRGLLRRRGFGTGPGRAGPAARAALAVQDDPLVLRKALEGGTREDFTLGNEHRARDGDDLILVRLAHVDEQDVIVAVEHVLELGGRDGRPGCRLLRVL